MNVSPRGLKDTFKDMIQSGEARTLCSPVCHTGKTTVARAICNELNADHIVINVRRAISTHLTTIRDFASTVSLNGGKKVVLDEFDYSNANSINPHFGERLRIC